jgi:hypothetical protein
MCLFGWFAISRRAHRLLCASANYSLVPENRCTGHYAMEYDKDKVDDCVLALLFLTLHDESDFGARAWKGHDWDALNRLHERGLIDDPKNTAKSVVLTKDGVQKSRNLFRRPFGKMA